MFVTTGGRTNQYMIDKAKGIADALDVMYVPRRKKSIHLLQHDCDSDCLVVGKERLELYKKGETEPFFFHPNSAMFRIKRLLRGEHDPFAQAAQLSKGKKILDCTLGLAGDAIVASFLTGKSGQVIGIEGQKYVAYIVQEGLCTWDPGFSEMKEARERIEVVRAPAFQFLKSLPDASYDCVYFDPMFDENIRESFGIRGLTKFAINDEFDDALIMEALRVTKSRVVLKDHYKSDRFEKFGFKVSVRKNAKFHFGFIEK
ncbi:class I SAM-dependent methyltransferase [Neobacillus niacini]|uniref:class I SAM-dependent methyltransferase n=1 Tax=Neobacillus niacini TaxID=86668 RepID=UPI0021CB2568|nr:class I SAM-dependent methyltransferase [Neobacillus niacini]MCM3766653.1 class I SAM-dependent methyltransferase [Neobacillus niacini]